MLEFLRKPIEESHIIMQGVEMVINHTLKIALLYVDNPAANPIDYEEMEKHLKKQGYLLHLFIPPFPVEARLNSPK